jgi:hypothetical protein
VRILAGVGAWLLGAGTATAGSLMAVSLLGQGIADSPGQQLTTAAVSRALAQESAEASPSDAPATHPAARRRTAARAARSRAATAQPSQPTQPASTPSARPGPSRTPASPAPSAAGGTVLMSAGGTTLAECRPAGAYLMSWSPTQGYEAASVVRGPAATARVVFESDANSVTMVVSCPAGGAGAPITSSYTQPNGDDTGDE